MSQSNDGSAREGVDRRQFLLGAGALAAPVGASIANTLTPNAPSPSGSATLEDRITVEHSTNEPTWGSDYMVEVFAALGIEHVIFVPGSSFRGLHESLLNCSVPRRPKIISCKHEQVAAIMAHSYAKAANFKPLLAIMHGDVGLLHTGTPLLQAHADRVPVYAITAQQRTPTSMVSRPHSGSDLGALVQDFTKWTDEPARIESFLSSAMQAWQTAMLPPRGPVMLTLNAELQEQQLPSNFDRTIAPPPRLVPPVGDANAVREAARLLVAAERPLILAQRVTRSAEGWNLMIQLAETLQAPVETGTYGSWHDFPSHHSLSGSGGDYQPDVILGLEVSDMTPAVERVRAAGGKCISLGCELLFRSRNLRTYGPWAGVDLPIVGSAEHTLPLLIEEIRRALNPARRRVFEARFKRIVEAHQRLRNAALEDARIGWNLSPISVPRMVSELAHKIADRDWAMVSGYQFTGQWQRRLLNFSAHYRYNGDSGAFGIGYDSPAAVGAALAHRGHGRLPVAIVGDGDFNFVGAVALRTAVEEKIPLLMLVHNNGAHHAEVMIVERTCGVRGRGADQAHIGTRFPGPPIDYAAVAKGYGAYAEGPIHDPADLGPAIERALARVNEGQPALIDVVSQPR